MKRGLVSGVVALVCLLAPTSAFAVGLVPIVPDSCNQKGGCQSICDLATLAQNILNDGIYVAVFLSAILFAWAGWKMIVGGSSGNPQMRNEGKKIIWNVSIGLVVIISAWIIVAVIMGALAKNPQWNSLCSQNVGAAQTGVGAQPY
ncbi:MAG TPA: pilin [Candidatus Paceibacterota bacterium]|nr:pilin [Candidatus Paceibacterota bacterium]